MGAPATERAVANLTLHDPCRREVEAHALSSPSQEEELVIPSPIVFHVPSGTYAELTIGAISGCTVDIGAGVTVLGLALIAAPTHGGRLVVDGPHLSRVWVKDADSELVRTDEQRPKNRHTGTSGPHHPVVIITNVIFAAVTSGMDPIIRIPALNGTVALSDFAMDMKVKLPAGARGMIATPPHAHEGDHESSSGSDDHESSSGSSVDRKADVAAIRIDASTYNATVNLSNVSISMSISTSVSATHSADLVGAPAAPTMFHGVLAEGGSLADDGADAAHTTVLDLQNCRIKVTADCDGGVGHSPFTAIGVAAPSIVASHTVTSVDVGGPRYQTEGLELNGELNGDDGEYYQRNAIGVSITKARTQHLSLADVSVDVTAPGNATAVHVDVERSLEMSISGGAFIAKTDTTSSFKKRRSIGTAKGANSTAIGILVTARIAPERSCFPPSTVTVKPDLMHAGNAAITTGMLVTGEFQGSWLITFEPKSLRVSGCQTAVGVHVMSFTPDATARPLPVLLPPRCNQLHNTSMRASFTDVVVSSNGEAIGVVCWKGPTVYGRCLVFPGVNMSVTAAKKAIGLAIYGAITILERGALRVKSTEGIAVGALMAPAPPTAGLVTINGAITVTAPTAIGVCSIGSVLVDGGVIDVTATNAGVAYGALVGNQGLGITVHNGEVHASHDSSSHNVFERSSAKPHWTRISFATDAHSADSDLDGFSGLTINVGALIQAVVHRLSSMPGVLFERHAEAATKHAMVSVAAGEVTAVRMSSLLITYLFTSILTVTTFAPAETETLAVAAIACAPSAASTGFIRTSSTVIRINVLPLPRSSRHRAAGAVPKQAPPRSDNAPTTDMTSKPTSADVDHTQEPSHHPSSGIRAAGAVTASGYKFNGTGVSIQAQIIGDRFVFNLPPGSKATGFDVPGTVSTAGVRVAFDAAFNVTSYQFEPVQLQVSNSFHVLGKQHEQPQLRSAVETNTTALTVFDAALSDYPMEIAGSIWIHAAVPPSARLLRSMVTCVVPPCPATLVNERSKSRIEEFTNRTKKFSHQQWSVPIFSARYDGRFGPLDNASGTTPGAVTAKISEGVTSSLRIDPGYVFVWVPSTSSKRRLDLTNGDLTRGGSRTVSFVVAGSAGVAAYNAWVKNPTDAARGAFKKATGLSDVTVIEGGPRRVDSPSSRPTVAAIVGGVSAAVVGVSVCAVVVLWILCRRRRSLSALRESDLGDHDVNPYVRAEALLDAE